MGVFEDAQAAAQEALRVAQEAAKEHRAKARPVGSPAIREKAFQLALAAKGDVPRAVWALLIEAREIEAYLMGEEPSAP